MRGTRLLCHMLQLFKTRKKKVLVLILSSAILFYIVHNIIEAESLYWDPPPAHFNYFLETSEYSNRADGYIVNTSNCQILNIDPWDKAIRNLFSDGKPTDCYARNRHWTYVRGQLLVINQTAMKESGYSFDSLSCCYKTIERVEQNRAEYDLMADNTVRFSSTCFQMSEETLVKKEFVKVVCTSKNWPFHSDVVYRQFHALALPHQSPTVIEKVKWWNEHERSQEKPPNVVIIGIDSMSRLSFHRSFPETKKVLEKIGAIEMLGYTKVGDNTLPNAVPFLTGYNLDELEKTCYFSPNTKFDLCPFIWKRFGQAGYLTAYNEDVPFLNAFNYLKTGFVEQPTDFYFRPFMLGVSQHIDNTRFVFDCIGYNTVHDVLVNYNYDLLNLSKTTGAPIFMFSWMTGIAHQDLNAAKFADTTFANFFNLLQSREILENTLLFFISDHGYRYGEFRQTFQGWYEDKLPFFWMYAPRSLRQKLPNAEKFMTQNSRRLSSPFDLYHTIAQVLKLFGNQSLASRHETKFHQNTGQSLFSEIAENRKCSDAGIPSVHCACIMPKNVNVGDNFLVNSADAVVKYLNSLLPEQCATLSLSKITGGAVLKTTRSNVRTYVVTFVTEPGQFLFEANVKYSQQSQDKEIYTVSGNVLRLNKMSRDTSCVKNHVTELYCYCK